MIEKTFIVTRIKTINNEIVTLPNSAILNSPTINFSDLASLEGFILTSTVSISYDVPWRKVHELLIFAALATENIESKPEPEVFQKSLNDFYITYEIRAYTKKPNLSPSIHSNLHENIQDAFNEASVEILFPHYRVIRSQ